MKSKSAPQSVAFLAVVFIELLLPSHSQACSMQSCRGNGKEFAPTFSVRVLHDKKPLSGATVTLHGRTPVGTEVESVIVTDSNGIAGLHPGNYWMTAEFLGIGAWSDCFHVNSNSSILATRRVTAEWGNLPDFSSDNIDGTLVESRMPSTGTLVWRASHWAEVAL